MADNFNKVKQEVKKVISQIAEIPLDNITDNARFAEDLGVDSMVALEITASPYNSPLLTEAAQAEKRAAIGTMAAGIHHEVGNPLNKLTKVLK